MGLSAPRWLRRCSTRPIGDIVASTHKVAMCVGFCSATLCRLALGALDTGPELRNTFTFVAANARRDSGRLDAGVGRLAAGLELVMLHT